MPDRQSPSDLPVAPTYRDRLRVTLKRRLQLNYRFQGRTLQVINTPLTSKFPRVMMTRRVRHYRQTVLKHSGCDAGSAN